MKVEDLSALEEQWFYPKQKVLPERSRYLLCSFLFYNKRLQMSNTYIKYSNMFDGYIESVYNRNKLKYQEGLKWN